MIIRLRIALQQEEYSALLKLANEEERNPEGQLRYILRNELKRHGFVLPELSTVNDKSFPESPNP